MGCCSSKPTDDTTRDPGRTEPKPATNVASSEANISTASDRQVSLLSGTDFRQLEFSGRTAGWAETVSIQPPTSSSRAQSSSLPENATFPPQIRPRHEIDELRDGSSSATESSFFGSDVQVSLPTGTDITQFESSGRPAGWVETMSIQPPTSRYQTRRSTSRSIPHIVVGSFNPSEIPGQPPIPPLPSPRSRQGSFATQPDEAPKSHRPSASTDPDKNFPLKIDELQGLSSASGKLSERVKAWDRTGQLTERTKPKSKGGFSDVSQAKLGDRVVAVKALRITNMMEGGESRIWKRLAREIYIWAALDHPNVLELLGFAIEDGMPCLISPWCDNGTLQEYLQGFPDANRRRLVREIAEGLRYLHLQKPPIIHGDLKTTNVFITGDYVAKISDFGTSKRVEQLRTGFTTSGLVLATIRYTAPEILRDGQHPSLSSDVFSFGRVALETMTDKLPFWKVPNGVDVISEVVFKKQTPSPEDHPGMEAAIWELLRRCWNYDPSGRPKMIDVCKMLSRAGYGSSAGLYPPTRAGPSATRVGQLSRPGHSGLTVLPDRIDEQSDF